MLKCVSRRSMFRNAASASPGFGSTAGVDLDPLKPPVQTPVVTQRDRAT
ncbi:MAG: hypothetical protein QOF83_1404 [Solirubrobacteraceae bacterium]|jgi:hypothetical protein|nr:hypothetical protein [Solirubrobacteraceae bacterium]